VAVFFCFAGAAERFAAGSVGVAMRKSL